MQRIKERHSAHVAELEAAPLAGGLTLAVPRVRVLNGRRRLLGGFQSPAGVQRVEAAVPVPARRGISPRLQYLNETLSREESRSNLGSVTNQPCRWQQLGDVWSITDKQLQCDRRSNTESAPLTPTTAESEPLQQ